MDSLQFYKDVVLADLFDRNKSDALLERILQWVSRNALPERTFSDLQLDHWATMHGYSKFGADELVQALRETQAFVVRGTPLSTKITDLIYRYRTP